jgi:hypothetical protein
MAEAARNGWERLAPFVALLDDGESMLRSYTLVIVSCWSLHYHRWDGMAAVACWSVPVPIRASHSSSPEAAASRRLFRTIFFVCLLLYIDVTWNPYYFILKLLSLLTFYIYLIICLIKNVSYIFTAICFINKKLNITYNFTHLNKYFE